MSLTKVKNNDNKIISMWLSDKSDTSKVSYKSNVGNFLSYVGKPLNTLTLEDLISWKEYLEIKYKPITLKNKLMSVKSLLTYSYEVGYLPFNIGKLLRAKRVNQDISKRILSEDEVRNFLSVISYKRDKLLFQIAYVCGLRVSEIINLRWQDINIYNNNVVLTIWGKGNKVRYVILPKEIDLFFLKRHPIEHVFTSCRGSKLDRTSVNNLAKKYAKVAGISKKFSIHWLRHCHATHSLNRGAALHLVQRTLGHTSLETTSKYLHLNSDESSSLFISL